MGSKPWQKLGVFLLAGVALAGCTSGPPKDKPAYGATTGQPFSTAQANQPPNFPTSQNPALGNQPKSNSAAFPTGGTAIPNPSFVPSKVQPTTGAGNGINPASGFQLPGNALNPSSSLPPGTGTLQPTAVPGFQQPSNASNPNYKYTTPNPQPGNGAPSPTSDFGTLQRPPAPLGDIPAPANFPRP